MHTECTLGCQSGLDPAASPDDALLSPQGLARQNRKFQGTAGVSKGNVSYGFSPAFLDQTNGIVYLSRFLDGTAAPVHVLDGLPDELVTVRKANGRATAVKEGVIAGFTCNGLFYTRAQADKAISYQNLH